MKKNIPILENKSECCGCGVCVYFCRTKAINLKQDIEGFFYPEIDEDKCVGCKMCVTVCAFKERKASIDICAPII